MFQQGPNLEKKLILCNGVFHVVACHYNFKERVRELGGKSANKTKGDDDKT